MTEKADKLTGRGPLDKYLKKIKSEEDQVLFSEATAAAKIGTFRASYIMTWLSCAESLKRRFRAIAPRDHVAKKIAGEVDRLEKERKAVDGYLLEKAREYGFISDSDFARLEHVYAMRCVYGHPYEEAPSREDLISAASTVVETVLAKPLKLHEGYIASQVQLITQDPTFLDDKKKPVAAYAQQVFSKVDDAKHSWFMDKLWAALESYMADPSMSLFVRRATWFSEAYLDLDDGKVLSERSVVEDLVRFPGILTLVLSCPPIFARIDEHGKTIVVGRLLELGKTNASAYRRLEELESADCLSERDLERFREALSDARISRLVAKGIHPRFYVEKFIDSMTSYNWYAQNPAIDALANVEPTKLAELEEGVLRRLGNNLLQCAEGESGSAKSLIEALAQGSQELPAGIIIGAFEECVVNERDEIRFKNNCADDALEALRYLPEGVRSAAISELAQRVRTGTWKNWYAHEKRDAYLKSLQAAIDSDPAVFRDLSQLKQSLEQKDAPDEDEEC